MMISPRHETQKLPLPDDWSIELKIDIFHAQVDGWYLEIADRIINGWQGQDGEHYIQGVHPSTLEPTHHIADAGWAALHIAINYFETIRFYQTADKQEYPGDRFQAGVKEVFPDEDGVETLAEILYKNVRSGLYHAIAKNPRKDHIVRLDHPDDINCFHRDEINRTWIIDPHNLIRHLRGHLNDYVSKLQDPAETDARRLFEMAFDMRVLGQE